MKFLYELDTSVSESVFCTPTSANKSCLVPKNDGNLMMSPGSVLPEGFPVYYEVGTEEQRAE